MHLQCTMSFIFDWEVRRLDCLSLITWRSARKSSTGYQSRKYFDWACANALKHGTASGFGYFHKYCRFLWKKLFQRQIKEVQYTMPTRHITHVSDFVWFQMSYGSMKSVSSFSSTDTSSFVACRCWLNIIRVVAAVHWKLDKFLAARKDYARFVVFHHLENK